MNALELLKKLDAQPSIFVRLPESIDLSKFLAFGLDLAPTNKAGVYEASKVVRQEKTDHLPIRLEIVLYTHRKYKTLLDAETKSALVAKANEFMRIRFKHFKLDSVSATSHNREILGQEASCFTIKYFIDDMENNSSFYVNDLEDMLGEMVREVSKKVLLDDLIFYHHRSDTELEIVDREEDLSIDD